MGNHASDGRYWWMEQKIENNILGRTAIPGVEQNLVRIGQHLSPVELLFYSLPKSEYFLVFQILRSVGLFCVPTSCLAIFRCREDLMSSDIRNYHLICERMFLFLQDHALGSRKFSNCERTWKCKLFEIFRKTIKFHSFQKKTKTPKGWKTITLMS